MNSFSKYKNIKGSLMILINLYLVSMIIISSHGLVIADDQPTLEMAKTRALNEVKTELQAQRKSTENLRFVSEKDSNNLDLDVKTFEVKIMDQNTATLYSFWFDENLRQISEQEAFEIMADAYTGKFGRLSRDLYYLINNDNNRETIPVAIWAIDSNGETFTYKEQFKIYFPLIHCQNCLTPMESIIKFIEESGFSTDYISTEVPVVYAKLPSSLIFNLQSQPYVAAIYLQTFGYKTMESAARTSAAPWTWERSITGSGIKVAVLEDDGVAFDSPYLNGDKYFINWFKRIGSHATQVAGVIASTHSTKRGIAYGAEILSANALTLLDSSVVSAADWAIESGANIINVSYGSTCGSTDIQSIDKYFDWLVWQNRVTVVASAGNLRATCPENFNVSSPGKAYNIITVGAKNDYNTANTTDDVSDDQLSSFSLYEDPTTATENRLKPEVVATGERILSTSETSPWITTSEISGTSFSAPIVAGEAALMMQRAPWLKSAPEAVKAGIMASSRWTFLHDHPDYNQWAPVEKMGVGAIDTTAADNSLINDRVKELYLSQSDFKNGYYDINFDVIVPERIRVVITWSSHPSRTILNWILHDRLESDFDLAIISPSNRIYGSYANEANYEIVEFVAQETGQFKARIYFSRWDDASMIEKLGFAWYSGITISP